MRRTVNSIMAMVLALFLSAPVQAWDGVVSGAIVAIDVVADGDNQGFRVYMDAAETMCTGSTATWGYINKSTSNYEALVAILNSAFLAEKTVTLYLNTKQGYCEIGYITMRK